MKILTVKLDKDDLSNICIVLAQVALAIEEGFTSGIEYPVNWDIRETKDYNNNLESLQNQIKDLRDSPSHFCPAVENEGDKCSCGRYDNIIDVLENMKLNE